MTGGKHSNVLESQGFEQVTLMLAVYDVWCLIILTKGILETKNPLCKSLLTILLLNSD